jgi:hypothetical protein
MIKLLFIILILVGFFYLFDCYSLYVYFAKSFVMIIIFILLYILVNILMHSLINLHDYDLD